MQKGRNIQSSSLFHVEDCRGRECPKTRPVRVSMAELNDLGAEVEELNRSRVLSEAGYHVDFHVSL